MPELTTASDALVSLKEAQLAKDPTSLTLDDVLAKAKAELAAAQELAAKRVADLLIQEQDALARLQAISADLVKKGYIGDGSLADFKILFEKDLAKFNAGTENFFSGKDPQTLAEVYRGDGNNVLEKLISMVNMYGG